MKVIATVGLALIGGVTAGAVEATVSDVKNCLYEAERLNYISRTVIGHNSKAKPAATGASEKFDDANIPQAATQSLMDAQLKLMKKIKAEGKKRSKTTDKKNARRIKKLGLKIEKKLKSMKVTQVKKMGTGIPAAPQGPAWNVAPSAPTTYTNLETGNLWVQSLASGVNLDLSVPGGTIADGAAVAMNFPEGSVSFTTFHERLSQKECVKLLDAVSSVFKAELGDDYDSSCMTMIIISALVVLAVLVAVLMMFCKSSNNDDDDM